MLHVRYMFKQVSWGCGFVFNIFAFWHHGAVPYCIMLCDFTNVQQRSAVENLQEDSQDLEGFGGFAICGLCSTDTKTLRERSKVATVCTQQKLDTKHLLPNCRNSRYRTVTTCPMIGYAMSHTMSANDLDAFELHSIFAHFALYLICRTLFAKIVQNLMNWLPGCMCSDHFTNWFHLWNTLIGECWLKSDLLSCNVMQKACFVAEPNHRLVVHDSMRHSQILFRRSFPTTWHQDTGAHRLRQSGNTPGYQKFTRRSKTFHGSMTAAIIMIVFRDPNPTSHGWNKGATHAPFGVVCLHSWGVERSCLPREWKNM